jgi:hypothetical protein
MLGPLQEFTPEQCTVRLAEIRVASAAQLPAPLHSTSQESPGHCTAAAQLSTPPHVRSRLPVAADWIVAVRGHERAPLHSNRQSLPSLHSSACVQVSSSRQSMLQLCPGAHRIADLHAPASAQFTSQAMPSGHASARAGSLQGAAAAPHSMTQVLSRQLPPAATQAGLQLATAEFAPVVSGMPPKPPGEVAGFDPAEPGASGATVGADASLGRAPLPPAPLPEPLEPGSAPAESVVAEPELEGGLIVSAVRFGATSTRAGAAVPGFRSSMAQPAAHTVSATAHSHSRSRATKGALAKTRRYPTSTLKVTRSPRDLLRTSAPARFRACWMRRSASIGDCPSG